MASDMHFAGDIAFGSDMRYGRLKLLLLQVNLLYGRHPFGDFFLYFSVKFRSALDKQESFGYNIYKVNIYVRVIFTLYMVNNNIKIKEIFQDGT